MEDSKGKSRRISQDDAGDAARILRGQAPKWQQRDTYACDSNALTPIIAFTAKGFYRDLSADETRPRQAGEYGTGTDNRNLFYPDEFALRRAGCRGDVTH